MKELLPGLPPYEGGCVCPEIYNAGQGLHARPNDERPIRRETKRSTAEFLYELALITRFGVKVDRLTEDGETSEDERKQLETLFRAAVKDDQLDVQLKPFKADDMIALITVDEQNRRFAEMSARWGGPEMNLPQKRTLLLNSKHPLVSWLKTAEAGENTDAVCEQIVDLAEMARQPLVADRMVEFLKRSNALLTKVIAK